MKFPSKVNHFVALILTLFIGSLSAIAQDAPLQGFDNYVNKALKDWDVPGVAIAIIKDDKIVFAKGYGVREIGKPDKVDERTLFAIGSSTKAFTAASIAMLVDDGNIKWDEPATKYLPGFQLYDPTVTREMTVRDLLTHRIGLERGDQLWHATEYDRGEVMRRIRFLKPSSSLRSKFGYQNVMYLAAGQIVPQVAGKTWDDFLRERIFSPLGMNSTSTSTSALKNSNDVAAPHSKFDEKVTAIPYRKIDNIGPAGSINSNVVDMAQWVRVQLNNGKFDGKQLISAASIKEMHAPQTIIRLEGTFSRLYPEAHFLSYGMGWFLSDYRGKKLVEHGGSIDGMRALVAMLPEEKLGVVILTNLSATILSVPLSYRIFDAYLGAQPRDWSKEMLMMTNDLLEQGKAATAKKEAERVKDTKPSLALENYAGNYQNEMYGDTKIVVENGKLIVARGAQITGDLDHWHYDTFRVTWRDRQLGKGFVNFRLNSQGKVDVIDMENFAEFTRVPETKAEIATK